MSTPELIVWAATAVIVITMVNRSWSLAKDGLRWWLRPSMTLLFRLPGVLLGIWGIYGGIELVYNFNAWAWFPTDDAGHVGFRWWLLLLTPVVLTVASVGFTIPYLSYLVLIPHIERREQLAPAVRHVLVTLLAIGMPAAIVAIEQAL